MVQITNSQWFPIETPMHNLPINKPLKMLTFKEYPPATNPLNNRSQATKSQQTFTRGSQETTYDQCGITFTRRKRCEVAIAQFPWSSVGSVRSKPITIWWDQRKGTWRDLLVAGQGADGEGGWQSFCRPESGSRMTRVCPRYPNMSTGCYVSRVKLRPGKFLLPFNQP